MKLLLAAIVLCLCGMTALAQETKPTVAPKPCENGVVRKGVIDRECALFMYKSIESARGVYAALIGLSARIDGIKINDLTVDNVPTGTKLDDKARKAAKWGVWNLMNGAIVTDKSNRIRLARQGNGVILSFWDCPQRRDQCRQLSSMNIIIPPDLLVEKGLL